ncbi:MAG: hypothetical protein NTV01_09475 [Bacteroidia bacterium]|nr:hypothetical protein [Bacteroidia bacterium]
MAINNNTKTEFKQALLERNLFWSYAIVKAEDLPDDLLIGQVLGYGEPDDILRLKEFFKLSRIKKVWQQQLIPDPRFKNANVWLAKVIFNIRQADKYIDKYSNQNSRYDRLQLLAAKD